MDYVSFSFVVSQECSEVSKILLPKTGSEYDVVNLSIRYGRREPADGYLDLLRARFTNEEVAKLRKYSSYSKTTEGWKVSYQIKEPIRISVQDLAQLAHKRSMQKG